MYTYTYIYIYVNLQFNLMHTLDEPAVRIAPSVLPGDQLSDRDWIVAQGRRGGKERGRWLWTAQIEKCNVDRPRGSAGAHFGDWFLLFGVDPKTTNLVGPDSPTFVDSNPRSHIGSGARRAHGTRGKPGALP